MCRANYFRLKHASSAFSLSLSPPLSPQMGNWRNRFPRRIYRQQNPPRSPPEPYDSEPQPGFVPDNVPSWEKRFCYEIGSVPWRKIVNSHKYMYCHNNILSWNDSAGEEAFRNAKKRYWSEINGQPCDKLLPGPDIYVDEIDWNPVIDPEIIKELDREYCALDDEGSDKQRRNKKSKHSVSAPSDENSKNKVDNVVATGIMEGEDESRNQWDNHIIFPKNFDNNNDSWECKDTQVDRDVKNNLWGDYGKSSWGWNQMESDVNQSRERVKRDCDNRNWNNGDNPWDCDAQGFVSRKSDGWGDPQGFVPSKSDGWGDPQGFVTMKSDGWGNSWDNSRGWNQSNNMENAGNPQVQRSGQHGGPPRGWRDYGGGKHWNQGNNNQRRDYEYRRTGNCREAWNDDSRKREGFNHTTSSYKNSRFRGDENQTRDCWRRGNNRKRVNFAFD